MIPEIIFTDGDEKIMKRPATLGDVKKFLQENNGQIDGRQVKIIRADLTSDLKLASVEFEFETEA